MRKIINWILLLFTIFMTISLLENIGADGFNGGHLVLIACIGGLGYWLFNRICDARGVREAFGIIKNDEKPMPVEKRNLICPNDAHDAVAFLARLVIIINCLMPYAQNSESTKIHLSIWENEDKKTATLGFWYDKDNSTMKKVLLTHYNLEDKFHFTDDGWINYDSKEILNFTPEWVNETNAERVITYTFLNTSTYAKVLDASCGKHDGQLSCFFTFGF